MHEEKKKWLVSKEMDPKVSVQRMKRPMRFFKRIIRRKSGYSDWKNKIEYEDSKPSDQDESSKEDVSTEEIVQNFDEDMLSEHTNMQNNCPIRLFSRISAYGDIASTCSDESSKEDVSQEKNIQNFKGNISSVEQASVQNFRLLSLSSIHGDDASFCSSECSKEDVSQEKNIQNFKGHISSIEQASVQNSPFRLISLSYDCRDDTSTCSGECSKEDVSQEEKHQNHKENDLSIEQANLQNSPLRFLVSSLSSDCRDDASTYSGESPKEGVFQEEHFQDFKGNVLPIKNKILQLSPICLLSVSSLGSNFGDDSSTYSRRYLKATNYQLLASTDKQSSANTKDLVDEHLSGGRNTNESSSTTAKKLPDEHLSGVRNTNESSRNDMNPYHVPSLDESDEPDEKELFTLMNYFINDTCSGAMTCRQSNEGETNLYERKSRSEILSGRSTTVKSGGKSPNANKMKINPHSKVSNNILQTTESYEAK